ncbi:hypothetical protein [Pseudaminobacter sp. NGMCC 1.201702]|uniref:hypothetical protein n=1 Tax=Pseudaminobacter sp. NGMCC 1.201702 TaxID=3391825 RepID=UPI0039EF7BB5
MAYQHDILSDIQQMAANEGLFTKAEIVEMLVEAADAIAHDRQLLRKVRAGVMEALGHLEASPHLNVNRQKSSSSERPAPRQDGRSGGMKPWTVSNPTQDSFLRPDVSCATIERSLTDKGLPLRGRKFACEGS